MGNIFTIFILLHILPFSKENIFSGNQRNLEIRILTSLGSPDFTEVLFGHRIFGDYAEQKSTFILEIIWSHKDYAAPVF